MSEIRIARSAYSLFYSTQCSVLVDERLYKRLEGSLPKQIPLFLLTRDRVITLVDGVTPGTSDICDAVGMASGLKAAILGMAHADYAQSLLNYCEFHQMRQLPKVYLAPKLQLNTQAKISAFLVDVMAEEAQNVGARLGVVQQQMVGLRGRYERLWLGYEKARRMIKGVGYNLTSISFNLKPGGETIRGPEQGIEKRYVQALPTDLAGFAGIELYVATIAQEGVGGVLSLRIVRAADRALLGAARLDYGQLSPGWNRFAFAKVIAMTHGDALLEVIWSGPSGPAFALADVEADRFGDSEGQTLAMRILNGLEDPSIDVSPMVRAAKGTDLMPIGAATLYGSGRYLGGTNAQKKAAAELGGEAVTLDRDSAWLQTHTQLKNVTGWRVEGVLHKAVQSIIASVENPHKRASPCLFTLLAVSDDVTDEKIEGLVKKIGAPDGLPLQGQCPTTGSLWCSALRNGGESAKLDLALAETGSNRDMVLVARSIDGTNTYGHARWVSIEVRSSVEEESGALQLVGATSDAAGQNTWQIRTYSLSEHSNQITFVEGNDRLEKVFNELGFSPMTFNEETGALQTHPYAGKVSAAILARGAPVGTQRLSCELGTAHPQAPDFTYFLATIPCDAKNKAELVQLVSDRVKSGEAGGTDAASGVAWNSVTLPATVVHTLALEFIEPQADVFDVVFAAVSPVGNDSYGWCRWYRYDVATVLSMPTEHDLTRPSVAEAS